MLGIDTFIKSSSSMQLKTNEKVMQVYLVAEVTLWINICDDLGALIPFAKFKNVKNEGVFIQALARASLLYGSFSRFLHFPIGTKSRKASHIVKKISNE